MSPGAIQTRYKGYHFRSRLEARWAIWLDAIGWDWQYEPEGYVLYDGSTYLPDFLIGRNLWLEIKAIPPTPEELRKARMLADLTEQHVAFGIGLPDPVRISAGLLGFLSGSKEERMLIDAHADDRATPGRALTIDHYCFSKWGSAGIYVELEPQAEDHAACAAARSARFEHGEVGAT